MEVHPFVWPSEFLCPISRSVMADPVIVSSGQTYERRCIQTWLDLGQTICVKHSTALNPDFIIPNIAVRDAIANLARSKSIVLPSPPSPGHARALATHLISELQASNYTAHTSDFSEKDASYISDSWKQTEGQINQINKKREESTVNPDEELVKSFRKVEMEGEGDAIDRNGSIDIRNKQRWEFQKSSYSEDYLQRNTADRGGTDKRHRQSGNLERLRVSGEQKAGLNNDYARATRGGTDQLYRQSDNVEGFRVSGEPEQRAGSHDGYNRYARATRRSTVQTHKQSDIVKGSGVVSGEPTAGSHDGYNRYTLATGGDQELLHMHKQSDNVEEFRLSREQRGSSQDDYSRYSRSDGSHDGYSRYTRADGYHSSSMPIRYLHSASGEVLLETTQGRGELPPNLVTKPSSYSSTEAPSSPMDASSLSSMRTFLVEKLQDPMPESHEGAVIELRQLTRMCAEYRASLCCPDLIHVLLPHLKSQSSVVQINAVIALVNLSLEEQNKVMIVRSGAVPFLVEVLKRGFPEAQEHAAGAVFSLALADENKDPIGVLNAIPPLVRLLHSGPTGSHRDAAMALYQLSLAQANRSKLVKVGAVPILLKLAESEGKPDLASSALLILCNVAAIPEGRTTLLEHNAIPMLVDLLAERSNKHVPEHAAATLLLLSKENRRFKTMALRAGAHDLLTILADMGTPRAREKALALLAIMKESSSGTDDLQTDSRLSRQYLRRNKGRLDGVHMNSSAF